MTELGLAYGDMNGDEGMGMKMNEETIEKKIKQVKKLDIDDMYERQSDKNIPINFNETLEKKKTFNPSNSINNINTNNSMNNMNVMNNMNNIPVVTPTVNTNNVEINSDTFWNRFVSKKSEIYKLFLFSFVIIFAISIDKMLSHYLNKYINDNILTNTQEVFVRLAYPIVIILTLWILKAI
jgi:hypothetical protein